MSDDDDGGPEDHEDSDHEYGEGGIPADMEADIEERVRDEVDARRAEIYDDARPRSGGCLLILSLPVLGLWFLG